MNDWNDLDQVRQAFNAMRLPIVERDLESIRDAKEQFMRGGLSSGHSSYGRVTFENGAGDPVLEGDKHAKLGQGTY